MSYYETQAPTNAGAEAAAPNSSTTESSKYEFPTFSNTDSTDSSRDSDSTSSGSDIGLTAGNKAETLSMFQQMSKATRDGAAGLGLPAVEFLFEADEGGEQPAPKQGEPAPVGGEPPPEGGEPAPEGEEVPTDIVPAAPTPIPIGTSDIPRIRHELEKNGIDPKKTNGITIGIIDQDFDDEDGHGRDVRNVISDKDYGLIPSSTPTTFERPEWPNPKLRDYADKKNGLNDFIADNGISGLETTTKHLKDVISKSDPSMRVINMSFGSDNIGLSKDVMSAFVNDPEGTKQFLTELVGAEKAQQFIDSKDKDFDNKELNTEIMQKIVDRVDKVVADDPRIAKAKEEYRETTKAAAEKGITLVVAAGNSEDDLKEIPNLNEVKTAPGDGFNWLAQSDHVISVGATDNNESSSNYADDTVAGFSSHGDGKYNPTVVAHGKNVDVTRTSSNDSGESGTSIAAPQVTATIALMLAQNKNMSFQQVKETLQSNTTVIANTPKEAQGAGIVQPVKAIEAAKNSAA